MQQSSYFIIACFCLKIFTVNHCNVKLLQNCRIRKTVEEQMQRIDHSRLYDEAAGELFWRDAYRDRGCRRPAGAEGRESSFGLPPRENVSECHREEQKEEREGREGEYGGGDRNRKERREKERCNLMAGEKEIKEGRGGGWGEIRGDNKLLIELLCFQCWNMDIQGLTERAVEGHHRLQTQTLTVDLQTDKHIQYSLSFKLLFCNWCLLGICW